MCPSDRRRLCWMKMYYLCICNIQCMCNIQPSEVCTTIFGMIHMRILSTPSSVRWIGNNCMAVSFSIHCIYRDVWKVSFIRQRCGIWMNCNWVSVMPFQLLLRTCQACVWHQLLWAQYEQEPLPPSQSISALAVSLDNIFGKSSVSMVSRCTRFT